MLSRLIAEQALAAALRTGGDFAEIFYEDTPSSSLTLNAGAIETALTGRTAGAGVRVYKGLSSVYVFTNDVSLSGLVRAAQKAADAIGSADRTVDVRLTGAIPRNIHAIAQLPMDVPGARRAQVVKAADAAARAVSAEVSQVTARLYDWETDVVIANSEGLFIPDRRVYTRLALTAVASGGGESQTGSCNPGAMMGFELFDGRVDPEEVGRRAAKQAVTMLHAEPCPAGVMCAVIDKGFGGVICVEAGGPTPGLGCAGRGIVAALDKLAEKGAYEVYKPDLVIYDVLGDVVCGGFSMPMRRGYADKVFVVTSGENMAIYAAANIATAIENFRDRGYASLGGLILNRRNVKNEQQKVEELAQELGTGIVGTLDHSDLVTQAEELGKTVLEAFPDSDMAQQYRDLAESLLRACREGGARV